MKIYTKEGLNKGSVKVVYCKYNIKESCIYR